MKVNNNFQQSPEDVIVENMHVVKKAVKKYIYWIKNLHILDVEDLESVGYLGLIRAYEVYDPKKHIVEFESYALTRAKMAINRYLYDFNPTLSFPRRAREVYYKIFKADFLEKPHDEISKELNISMSDVQIAMEYSMYTTISTSINIKEGEDFTIEDLLYSESDYDFGINLGEIMELLSDTQKKIFNYYFIKDYGQSEISSIINITQPSVSKNIRKIKEIVSNYMMDKNDLKVS